MSNNQKPPRCHARTVAEIVAALREIFGIERHVAINKAVCLAEEAYGLEMSAIKPIIRVPVKGVNE